MKRVLDLVLAALMLLASAPLWPLIALAIKIDSRGPVLFRQERWGAQGVTFELFKFRTMLHSPGSPGVSPALVSDPRVTRVGRLLRATGLDELPQLLNILRGEMSFVGPRALAVGEKVEVDGKVMGYEEVEGFSERLAVPPGLTGTATIYLPRDAAPLRKLQFDLRYIEERSLWLDIKLIVLSVWISLRGRWESRDRKY